MTTSRCSGPGRRPPAPLRSDPPRPTTLVLPSGGSAFVAEYTPAPERPSEADHPPVVFVHGFRGDHHGLDTIARFVVRRLRGTGRRGRVVAPDLPGFGATPVLVGRHDLAGYVGFLDDLLTGLGVGTARPAVLVGHSFGSIPVAHLAAARPDLVAGLVLVNPITTDPSAGPRRVASALTRGYYATAAALPDRAGRALLASPPIVRAMSEVMATTRDRAVRAWIHDQHARYFSAFASPGVVAEVFGTSIGHTVREIEHRLRPPLTVVAGDRDDIAPLAGQEAFVAAVPGARLVALAGVGHLVHYERPRDAADAVVDLLDELAADPPDAPGQPGQPGQPGRSATSARSKGREPAEAS